MSEFSKNQSTLRANYVTVLLRNFFSGDDQRTRTLAHILKDRELIGEDEHDDLCEKASSKQCPEAIDRIFGIFAEKTLALTNLENVLKHEDLGINKELHDLVSLLLREHNIEENLTLLINWWGILCANSTDVCQIISEIWPEKSLTDDMWPLKFIHFCATQTENTEKLNLFLQKVQDINDKEIETNQGPVHQYNSGFSFSEVTPESFSSYVMVKNDETKHSLKDVRLQVEEINFADIANISAEVKQANDNTNIEGLHVSSQNEERASTVSQSTDEENDNDTFQKTDFGNIFKDDNSTSSATCDSDEDYDNWFYPRLDELFNRRLEINVLLQLASPGCTLHLEDEKAWKNNIIDHITKMADFGSLYEDFKNLIEDILKRDQLFQTKFWENATDLIILRKWMKKIMPEMEKHTDIFTMLIKISWPGNKWLEENWKQVLLLKIYADPEKFILLASALHLIFGIHKISIPEASDPKFASKVSSSKVSDKFNKATAVEDANWLLESYEVLKEEYENLTPLLDIAWPKQQFRKKDGQDGILILLESAGLEDNWKIVRNFVAAARFVIQNKKPGRIEKLEKADFEINDSLIELMKEHFEKVNWVGWLALRDKYRTDILWLKLLLKMQSEKPKVQKLIRALKLLASVFQQSQQESDVGSTPGTDATEMPKSNSLKLATHDEDRSRSRQKFKAASPQKRRKKSESPIRRENEKKRSRSTSEQQYPTQVPHKHGEIDQNQSTGVKITEAPSEKIIESNPHIQHRDPVQEVPVVHTSSSSTSANDPITSSKEHDASSKGYFPKIKDADTHKRMHEMDRLLTSKTEVNLKRDPRQSTKTDSQQSFSRKKSELFMRLFRSRSVGSQPASKILGNDQETHNQHEPEAPPPYTSGNYTHDLQNFSESTKNLFPDDNQNEYSHETLECQSTGTRRKLVSASDDNEDEYSHENTHSPSRRRTRQSVEASDGKKKGHSPKKSRSQSRSGKSVVATENNTKRNEESPKVQAPVKKEKLYQKLSEKRSEPENTSNKYTVTFYVTCLMDIDEMNICFNTNGNLEKFEMQELPEEKNCFSVRIESWSQKFHYSYEYEENGTTYRELLPGDHRVVKFEPEKENIFFDVISMFPYKNENHQSEWSKQMYKYLCAISDMSSSTKEQVTMLLQAWVSQIKRGWKIGCNEGYQRIPLSVKAEDCLIEWLTECDRKVCSETKIITILLLLVVFEENNLKVQRSLDIVFLHLSLEDMNKEQQNRIQSDIFSAYTHAQERNLVAAQLKNLFNVAAQQPVKNWLLALPLLDLIEKKSITVEASSIKSPVREIDNRLPFADKLDLYTGKEYQQHFIELADKINKLSSQHLWLIDTYQILLDYESIIKVTKCNKEIAKKFELGNLLTILLEGCNRTTHEDINSYLQILEDIQDYIGDQFQYARSYTDSPSKKQTKKENKFALDVFDRTATSMTHVLKVGVNPQRASIWFIEIVHHASAMLTKQARKTLLSEKGSFCNICNEIAVIILSMELTDENVKFLDQLWTYEWVEPLQDYWNNAMTRALTEKLEKEDLHKKEKIFSVKLYLENINPLITQESLQDCFGQKAMELIEKELETSGSSCIAHFFGNKNLSTIKFVEKCFLRKYKEMCESKESQYPFGNLNFICKWQMANWLFSNFYEAEHDKYFGQKTNETMQLITADIKKIVEQIYSGKIKKNNFEFVKDKTATICNFVGILQKKSSTSSVDNLREHIHYLSKKQRDFDEQYGFAKTFFQFCKEVCEGLKVRCAPIETMYIKASQSETIGGLITKDDLPIEGLNKKYFGLTKQDIDDFHQMHLLRQSDIFRKMWFERTKQEVGFDQERIKSLKQMDWKDVLKCVWIPAKEDTIQLFKDTAYGSVKLDVLLEKFQCTKGSKSKIHEELQHLFRFFCKAKPEGEFVDSLAGTTYDEDKKKSCQIHSVFEINKAINVIRWICTFKETFDLQGTFESIEKLKNLGGTDLTLNDITDDFLKNFPDDLIRMSAENLQTLEKFIQQHELVKWLHSMKDIEEIKTLGQLALTSEFERALEMDKVECLTTSMEGFSPLICKLNEIKGLSDLLERFYKVWKNVEEDEDLVEKWTTTGENLAWFKEIEQIFGSEEKMSLSLAQEINGRGVYTIGKPPGNEHVTKENSITLSISMTEGSRAKGPYTLKELTDLHSKLTLIAGEEESGQRDIANFVELLTAIKLLASAYVDLVDAGCMLFADWSAVVMSGTNCGEIRKLDQCDLTFQIKFTNESSVNGKASISHLKKLSSILRNSYDRWSHYLNKKRLEHYYLNEYNIQQITYLCKELAKTKNTASLPDQVLALLSMSSDSRKLFSSSIRSALEEATKIDSVKMNAQLKNENAENVQYSDTESKRIAIRRLIEEEGLIESLAIAAVQAEGYKDLEECNNWVTLNELDTNLVEKLCQEFQKSCAFENSTTGDKEAPSLLHNRSSNTLTGVIKELQTVASKTKADISLVVSSICEMYFEKTSVLTLKDYLSVEHLGKFLTVLHAEGNVRPNPHRKLSHNLITGRQNLLICRDDEVLQTVLSIYMEDNTQPLPTASEVLICGEETTSDEVERFMRRAMCKCDTNGQQIYCMAYTEKLSFNVSKQLEKISDMISRNGYATENYRLILISSDQQHYISECFEKYQMEKPAESLNKEEVSKYLAQHLNTEDGDHINNPSVKVVSSKRSGQGKTLFIRNLKEKLDKSYHNTTIPLVEEWVDTELVIERLYRGDHIRNEHSHFIHLDLTPAVQYGIEKFMFDLLVLGSIQNKSGSIWHRQNNHQYVVEVTKSNLTHNQIPVSSILNLLPCIDCLGPDEAIFKSVEIRNKTTEKLKEIVTNATDSQNFGGVEKISQLLDQSYNWYEFVYQTNYEMQLSNQDRALLSILSVCDIPLASAKSILNDLPEKCRDEVEKLWTLTSEQMKHFKLADKTKIMSPAFQRPYQYLKYYEEGGDLDAFKYAEPTGTPSDCVSILKKYYTTPNPTWAQLEHFAIFLNVQLENCENSIFCQEIEIDGKKMWTMKGLKQFAVKFMIRMSQDFATPSLEIHDESNSDIDHENAIFNAYKVRRKWENKAHPYVFFNEDGSSMTFINVHIDKNGDLLNEKGLLLEKNIASQELVVALKIQEVPINTDFYKYDRKKMLNILSTVMGLQNVIDPDCTFELTTDNVLKILAIYMRMRCGIPVIIMGETGCGKTRMVEFISKLNRNNKLTKEENQQIDESTKTLKIHGGVTPKDIYMSVEEANSIAENNAQHGIKTILFYDEANTTNAIYAIKEVMCDQTVNGELFQKNNLQIVAACNPYKELTKKALNHNNNVALGFHVAQDKTKSRLGNIPMRHLVYKVVALPPSMQPFVWDFRQLDEEAEEKYIGQMTKQLGLDLNLPGQVEVTKHVVSKAQSYMRKQLDECRYVSLRDVERCILCIKWFYRNKGEIFPLLEKNIEERYKKMRKRVPDMNPYMRCLIQTIGICYHVSLRERQPFRKEICRHLKDYIELDEADLDEEFIACQKAFLHNTKIDDNIARNEALRENVFLMTICSDLKIPLFIIGKPGSSKSLAKTIVGDNMKGSASGSNLYKRLKKIQILNYQCSALTDAAGIARIFSNGAKMQKNKKLSNFTVVIVLDEIGLAEDSKNMPLKILHPLLESGSTKSGTLTEFKEHKIVGFVGISNWALDPAKMNRGIFVTRSTPEKEDLIKTAKGIFHKDRNMMQADTDILQQLTYAYLAIYNTETKKRTKEYFGLRDYYCLIKMIHAKKSTDGKIKLSDIMYFVQRNFSGGVNSHFNSFFEFVTKLFTNEIATEVSVQTMIRDNLEDCESRFMLLLTNQYSSVSLLEKVVPNFATQVQVIFGSSFPGDHSYTELCRNINKIKVCMETGRTVVLLGTSEIHESLYDALNQHYIVVGGKRYVDIGLGGHRVKCRMSKDFRLIIIEKQETVYETYPIPLINRLEKYHLLADTILNTNEKILLKTLEKWVDAFSNVVGFNKLDAFVGYNDDTVSSTILAHGARIESLQDVLLQSATIDSVFRLKSNESNLKVDGEQFFKKYLDEQVHDTLLNALDNLCNDGTGLTRLEITSFSNILTDQDRKKLEEILCLPEQSVMLLSLNQFQTQDEYIQSLNEFFTAWKEENNNKNAKILLIQCPQAHKHEHGELLACARYNLMNALKQLATIHDMDTRPPVIVAFLLSTKRQSGYANAPKECLIIQQSSDFQNLYIDELRPRDDQRNLLKSLCEKSLLEIFEMGVAQFNGFEENLCFDFAELIKDCICESMSKLKTDGFSSKRNVERINILKTICSEKKHFLQLLGQKMVELHKNSIGHDDRYQWIVKEAMSRANLQEGGTFTNCLNLCLKRYSADALAYIVSKVDENNNLNFLLDNIPWKQDMWLRWFECYQMSANDLHSKHEYIIKGNNDKTIGQLPFSSCIYDKLESIWKCIQDAPYREKRESFYNNYRQMHKQISIIKDAVVAGGEKNLIQAFAEDVIGFWLIQANDDLEKKHLTNILVAACMHEREIMVASKQYQDADSIAIVFYCFKEYERHLTMLHSVYLVCPEIFSVVDDSKWLVSIESKECYIYEVILIEMLKWFDGKALSIDENDCKIWMENSNKIKGILKRYLDELVRNQDTKAKLIKQHEPLLLFDLLLSHLLPTAENRDIFANYVRVIVAQAKRWIKASRKYAIKSKNFLKIISNALRKSYEAIRMKHLVSWQETICQMCREPKSDLVKLVCTHFICTKCLNNVFSSPDVRKQCPACPQTIEEDFTIRVHELSEEDKRAVAKFKSNCTSFFLQYLRQFCFTKTDSASKEEAKNLLHELVTLSTRETDNRTDLNEAINLNIATKSCIWLVLEGSFSGLNEEEMDPLYKSLDNKKLRDLVNVVLYSIETDMKTNTAETKQQLLTQCDSVRNSWDVIVSDTNDLSTDSIRAVSEIRCAITVLVSDIQKNINKKRYTVPPSLYLAIKEITKSDESQQIKKFIIKTGFQLFGKDWVYHVSANFKHFMPENLRNFVQENSIDYWLTMGQDYAESKFLLDNSSSGTFDDILLGWFPCQNETEDVFVDASEDTTEDHDYNNLTKYNLLTKVFAIARNKNESQIEQLKRHIENFESYRFLSVNDLFTYRPKFVNNQLMLPENRRVILFQLVSLAGCVALADCEMMHEFHELIMRPEEIKNKMWPAMPQSHVFMLRDAMKDVAAYECENGHVYTIGNCKRPWVQSHCPKCGVVIGGIYHTLAAGNKKVNLQEESQGGYQLNGEHKGKDDPSDRLSKQAVAILHFITHSCMLFGFQNDPDTMLSILNKENMRPVTQNDTKKYISEMLWTNLCTLAESLGRNLDDAILVMCECILNVAKDNSNNAETDVPTWDSIQSRQVWEKMFHQKYFLPVFQTLDEKIKKCTKQLMSEREMMENHFYRITHDVEMHEDKAINCLHPILWSTIRHPNPSHLLQTIGDTSSPGVIQKILQTPKLHLAKDLEYVLDLQKILIEKYWGKDLNYVEKTTFEVFMGDQGYKHKDLVKEYFRIWNSVRNSISLGRNQKLEDYMSEMNMQSSVAMGIPSSRGHGRCAQLLAVYLIKIHNDFLGECHSVMRQESSTPVPVSHLVPSNFIPYEGQNDFMKMIHTHTSYTIERDSHGSHHIISYNVDALEKQARESYAIYPPIIDIETLPCMRYPQDVGIGSDWKKTKERQGKRQKQVTLTLEIAQEVDDKVASNKITPADLYGGVRTLTNAISFLANVEADPEQQIREYLCKHLSFSEQHLVMIPKSALIKHTLALYQRLTWHKAVNFVQQNLDPYKEALYGVEQTEITDKKTLAMIKDAFDHMDIGKFQQNLNEILIQVPDIKPFWSLREDVFPDFEFIEEESTDSWYNKLPSEILYSNVSHLFKLSVNFRSRGTLQ
uniref:E3 ubiquitin-protein ligase rnf213-alpha-like n=1 Tax=Styela clava TaxID=7725 RepID=UPI00193A1480|nr:E3 ubiquitin-protein ligase rnf213-alpha-like [Styela clava]